jgi:uncharacterized delta-60 repeat protein
MRRPLFRDLVRLEDRVTPVRIGELDPTFGLNGIATPNVQLAIPDATTKTVIARQSDGRYVVGSTAFVGGTDTDFAIYRLNHDGSIDTTFGTGGLTTIPFDLGGSNADVLNAIAVDSNDRIVVVGSATLAANNRDFAVARLTPSGDLDTTFSGDGKLTIPFDLTPSLDDVATCVAIDQTRIVVGGTALATGGSDTDFAMARLTDAGILDSTFSTDGRQVIPFDLAGSTLEDSVTGIAVGLSLSAANRAYFLVGNVNNGGTNVDAGIVRLLENGQLDTTFNGTGKRVIAIDNAGTSKSNTIDAIETLGTSSLTFAGTVATSGTAGASDVYVVRLNASGQNETTFGTNGVFVGTFALASSGTADKAAAVEIGGGLIRIVGSATFSDGDTDFGIMNLLVEDGSYFDSFSENGRVTIAVDLGGTKTDVAYGFALDNDLDIVVAGTATTATGAKNSFARVRGTLPLWNSVLVSGTGDGEAAVYWTSGGKYVRANFSTPPNPLDPFPNYFGPVRTAIADFNGDGSEDYAYGVGPGGGSLIRVVDGDTGADLVGITSTIEAGFTGGVFLAAGDIDNDGKAELAVSPDQGGGGRIQVFSVGGGQLIQVDNFFGIEDLSFRGGARVAMGDVDGDGFQELVVGAGFGGGPRVAIFDGLGLLERAANPPKLVGDFFAFPGTDAVTLRNGVFVALGDLDGDGRADLVFGGGPGGGPRVFALDGFNVAGGAVAEAQANPLANFFVNNDVTSRGGIRIALKDVDFDDRADLVVGSGEGLRSEVRVYLGSSIGSLVGGEAAGALWQTFDPFGLVPEGGVFVG